jgi:hypothetical protein
MDQLVGSCDIGLAFYMLTDPNHELCGKGSGKLCRYLRLGKPAIVGSPGQYRLGRSIWGWRDREFFGRIVASSGKNHGKLSKILGKALTCYEGILHLTSIIHRYTRRFVNCPGNGGC